MLDENGEEKDFTLEDYALTQWKKMSQQTTQGAPIGFITAAALPPKAHLAIQAALQPFVDNSISKTIYVPEDYLFEDFQGIYDIAYDSGLKGCTVYRPSSIRGAVLRGASIAAEAPHCCTLERKGD
jgi:ribonucleoside-diphosphate reductase alpha chain